MCKTVCDYTNELNAIQGFIPGIEIAEDLFHKGEMF